MAETAVPAWWADLYSPRHGDTLSAGCPPVPPRIPPPGQVIDLDTLAEPEPDAPADPTPFEPGVPQPSTRTRRVPTGKPDHKPIARLEAEPDIDDGKPAEAPDDWSDIPERTAPDDQKAVLAGTAKVQQAVANLNSRARWLLYNGTAAGTGWCLHLVQPLRTFIAGTGDQVATVILGAGICALVAWRWDARTRGWWGPLPWLCRIPLASAVLALALYAPGASH